MKHNRIFPTTSTPPYSQLTALVLLLFGSAPPTTVLAQEPTTESSIIFSCPVLRDCRSCMINGTDCVFAAGECFTECTQGDNGASCYSAASHPELTSDGICDLYAADNYACTLQTTCEACLNTFKSDENPCQWYPKAFNNTGACFGGGTGPFGSGELTCGSASSGGDTSEGGVTPQPQPATPATTPNPTASPMTEIPATNAPEPATTDPPAAVTTTEAPATEAPVPASTETPQVTADTCMAAATDCQSCLGANCAWFPSVAACEIDCSGLADASCFQIAASNGNGNATQICQEIATAAADRELCAAQETDCATCLATTKSDGTSCRWYTDPANDLSWCGTGECNMDGICGSDTCSTDDGATDGATDAPVNEQDSPCAAFNGYGADGCTPCLSSPDKCAWSIDTCLSSCTNIADDAPCYHADTQPNATIAETCHLASVNAQDAKLCGRKNYCFTCTSTIQSDGTTPCAWYKDEAGNEWCGTGGCDANGVCGETDETVCQVPTDPPLTSSPIADSAPAEAPAMNGGGTSGSTTSSLQQSAVLLLRRSSVVVTTLLLLAFGVL